MNNSYSCTIILLLTLFSRVKNIKLLQEKKTPRKKEKIINLFVEYALVVCILSVYLFENLSFELFVFKRKKNNNGKDIDGKMYMYI